MTQQFSFKKAEKKQLKLRLAITGPSGSGKTYTALVAATVMAAGGKIAVVDTERGSASLYADKFDFDVLELETYHPQNYIDAIKAAEQAGYAAIVVDSLSHAWEGEGGALELVDKAAARNRGNSYVAWRDVTPLQREMVDAMLKSSAHIIATMRSKMDYVQEEDDRGKKVIRKVGMAPVQRAGMEYEFTFVGDMDVDHKLVVSKSRCDLVADAVVTKPGPDFFKPILAWLNSGAEQKPANTEQPKAEPKPAQPEPVAVAQPKQNGNGHEGRPYAPDKLRALLIERAGKNKERQVTETERNVLARALTTVFDGDETKRYEFLNWIAGHASTKEIAPGYVIAITTEWLKVRSFDDTPDALAVQEAQSALVEALKAQGQAELF